MTVAFVSKFCARPCACAYMSIFPSFHTARSNGVCIFAFVGVFSIAASTFGSQVGPPAPAPGFAPAVIAPDSIAKLNEAALENMPVGDLGPISEFDLLRPPPAERGESNFGAPRNPISTSNLRNFLILSYESSRFGCSIAESAPCGAIGRGGDLAATRDCEG